MPSAATDTANATAPEFKPQHPAPAAQDRPRGLGLLVRPIVFWTHLAAGVVAGVVVLVMSLTGTALTYQKQMTAWADLRGLAVAPLPSGATALRADSLLTLAQRAADARPTSLVVRAGVLAPVEVIFPEGRRRFMHPYTGAVLGEGSSTVRAFFRVMTDWHRWLAFTGDRRAAGRAVTGASNLAFLMLVLTGIMLWWPRRQTRIAFRNVMTLRRGLSSKARDFNWHNVIGFWSFAPLVIIVASGAVISYPWASDLVYRAAGERPPARERNERPSTSAPSAARLTPPPTSAVAAQLLRLSVHEALTTARATAAQRMPDWRAISLTLPRSDTAAFAFTIDRGMGGEPHKRAQLALAPTGEETRWQTFDTQNTARRWRSILRFAHTGEVLGVFGQTLAGVVSLGAALLVYTGLALSWRRLRTWQRRRLTGVT